MGLQPAAVQASQQEEALSQELASLENSTAHLRDLQFQLEVQLKQVHGAASHNLSDQQPEGMNLYLIDFPTSLLPLQIQGPLPKNSFRALDLAPEGCFKLER